VVVAGNPDVHPSTVDNVELDYDRALPEIGSILRAAAFAQRNNDLIVSPVSATPMLGPSGLPVLVSSNIGSSDAVGTEIAIKGHSAAGFRWGGSYAFVETTNGTTLNPGVGATSPVNYAHAVPQHVVVGRIGYTVDKLQLDLMGRWQSNYSDYRALGVGTVLQPVVVPNYVSLTARVAYPLTDNLLVAVVAQQFNAAQVRTAGPPTERRILASLTAHF
jgi:TonB dependent receptor-like, beta-barrel